MPSSTEGRGQGLTDWVPPLLLLGALWLATRPFLGIFHDAFLYLGQALLHLDPVTLQRDTAFVHGTQDRFSAFSRAYAPLIGWLGVDRAHAVMAAAGQAAWFGAVIHLARRLFPLPRHAVFAVASAILLAPIYGGQGIFSYGEPYATARPWAEAAVLMALAAMTGPPGEGAAAGPGLRRTAVASAWLLAALLFHPLMALPGMAVVALLAVRRWQWMLALAVAGGIAILGLALAGIEPFARLRLRFDGEWHDVVAVRSGNLFLGNWWLSDWLALAAHAAICVVAWRCAGEGVRRLLVAIGVTAVLGLAATAIGADLVENVLVTGLQPWRALWLLALVAHLCVPFVLMALPRDGIAWLALGAAVLASLIERLGYFPHMFSPAAIIAAAALAMVELVRGPILHAFRIVLVLPIALVLLAALAALAYALQVRSAFSFGAQSTAATLIAAVALGILLARATTVRGALWQGGLAGLLVIAAALTTVRQEPWDFFVRSEAERQEIEAFIDTDGEFYWEGGTGLAWFKLRRASGFHCAQGSGIVFFRGMAIAYRDRAAALAPLNTIDFDIRPGQICPPRLDGDLDGPADAAALIGACRAVPSLDVIILAAPVAGLEGRSWSPPVPMIIPGRRGGADREVTSFHRYDCRALR